MTFSNMNIYINIVHMQYHLRQCRFVAILQVRQTDLKSMESKVSIAHVQDYLRKCQVTAIV